MLDSIRRKSGANSFKLTAIIIISILSISVLSPIIIVANSITITLSDGKDDTNITFLSNGGSDEVSISFPFNTEMKNVTIKMEGFPYGASEYHNDSTYDDFNMTIRKRVEVELENNNASISLRDDWWNSSWYYRLEFVLNTTPKDRENITPSLNINFTPLLNALNIEKTFDMNSIRVVEHDEYGGLLPFNDSKSGDEIFLIPYNLTDEADFNITTSINLTLSWICKGVALNNTTRYFSLYFDTMVRPKSPPSEILSFTDDVVLLNQNPSVQDSFIFLSDQQGIDNTPDYLIPTSRPYNIEVEDVNRDGYLDIVIANSGTSFFDSEINSSIFLGGPNGYSTTPDIEFPTIGAYAAKVADFNKDGYMDIVFASNHNSSDYSINSTLYWGSPNGFNSSFDVEFDTYGSTDVEAGDFDDDGWLDIAFSNYYNGSNYDIYSHVYMGSLNGFSSTPDYLLPTNGSFGLTSGDVNKDGIPDLIFSNYRDDTGSYTMDNFIYFGSASGFQNTPDGKIRGNGTYAIETADLNYDGNLDLIVANRYNGISWDIDSFLYYYNASGIYQDPDCLLATHRTTDVSIGDVNGDGLLDIAFANNRNGPLYDTDSTIFLGNTSGYSQADTIGLGTHGAIGVKIIDLDRYYIDKDLDPPTISMGDIENKFKDNAFMRSQVISTDDDVHSIVASWSSTEPEGSEIQVFVSNDGGDHWIKTNNTDGTVFIVPNRELCYQVNFSTNNETPVLHWINITYFMGNYPTNVTLDIGGDGDIEWTESGTFNYTFTLNSSVIADELTNHTSPDRYYPWEYITVPMVFTSETSGIIHIYAINITHNSPPYQNSSFLLPDIKFNEDEARPLAFDLDDHFFDMDDDTLTYSFTGATNVNVLLTAENMVDLSAGPNWFGQELITFRAEDGDGGSVEDTIIVTVNPVNDPPVARIGTSSSNGTIVKNVTLDGSNSTDIDGTILHYIWDFGDGNFGTGVKVSHEYDLSGDFVVKLTVIDDGGMAGTAVMTITKGNVVPVAMVKVLDDTGLGFDTFVNVLIDMSGTHDPDGEMERFHLDFGDGSTALRMDGAPPMTWEHQYRDGTYTYIITLTVWDNNNASAEDTATVTINNVEPEIVTVSAPSVATVGQRVKFNVLAEDQDGSVSTYMWDFVGDGTFSWSSDLNGNATHKYESTGTYHATLKVVDDDGTSSFYRVTIEIKEDTKKEDVGMVLGLGIALLVIVVILGYIIFQQRSRIMGQKALLVKRDEVLREMRLEQETEMETTTGEEIDRIAPAGGKAETTEKEEEESDFEDVEEEEGEEGEVDEEEEDLGTLELMDEGEDDFEPDDIVREDSGEPTIRPLESTGIMPTKPSKPPVPEGLGDMIGAAQVTPVVPVTPGRTEEEEEEGVEEEEEGPEEEEPEEEEPVEERKPIAKARCPGCKALIPLYSKEKPMRIKCDSCGKEGVIK